MMTIEEQRKYIQEQRAKGVQDTDILKAMNQADTPAPQRSGVGEVLPTAFSVAGGVVGTMLAGPVGGIAGAGAGGSVGETIQQGIEKGFGIREKFNTGQIVATGAIDTALQATGAGIGKIFTKFAKPAFEASKPVLMKFVSKMSGYADNVLEKALQRTSGAVEGVVGGEQALVDVVQKTAVGISKYAKQTVAETQKNIAEFTKQSVRGALPGTKQNLLNEGLKYEQKIVDSLRQFNIGVNKAGELMFDRAKNISNIVSGGDKSAIQDAYNTIKTIVKNPDIAHIDSVLERLITLRTKTPVGSPTGAETRAILASMSDSVIDFVESIPKAYGAGYGKYAQFLKENLPKRIMISDAKEIFGGSEHLSPKELSQITKRMLQLYNTGNLAVKDFAEKVGDTIKQDITGTAAGTLLKTGDQQSVRAPNLTVRGFAEKAINYFPRKFVQTYVETGNIMKEFGPKVEMLAKTAGVSVKALMTEMANLMSNKTTR